MCPVTYLPSLSGCWHYEMEGKEACPASRAEDSLHGTWRLEMKVLIPSPPRQGAPGKGMLLLTDKELRSYAWATPVPTEP